MLGNSVVVDRGDSLRVAQLTEESLEPTLHVGDSELDDNDLQSLLEAASVETADGKGSRFLPFDELDRLLSERNVRRALLSECPDLPISTLTQILEATRAGVPPRLAVKKILAITTLLGKPGDVVNFLREEIYDSHLPLSQESLGKVLPPGSLQVASDNFLDMQWRVLAPFFPDDSRIIAKDPSLCPF